jgi:hypothetical protein
MRRVLILSAAVLAVVAAVVGGTWYWAAGRLLTEIAGWEAARRAEGYRISHGDPAVRGFPLRLTARLPDPVIATPAGAAGTAGWEWRAPDLDIEVEPWNFTRLTLRTRGTNLLKQTRDGETIPFTLDTEGLAVALHRPQGEAQRFDIDLKRSSATAAVPPVTVGTESLSGSLLLFRTPPGDHLKPAADLTLVVTALILEAGGRAVLKTPTSGRLNLLLKGAIPDGPPNATLPVWRDDGGTVEMKELEVTSGGVSVSATGTLALDARLRPMGAASAVIRGIGEAIDRMVEAGQVNPRDASLARIMLTAMSTPAQDGGPPVLRVPLSGQNGWLYVGPVRLARLEPLRFD